jgi:type 1 glutamine amidotransferase
MHIETIVSESVPAHMALIGMLAREYNIKVALGGSYREIVDALRHAESNVGACVNTAKLAQEGVRPDKLVSDLHDRIMIVELQDRPENPGSVPLNTTSVLKVLYSHGVKPSLFVTRTTGMASSTPTQELQRAVNGLDDALRPLIADQAAQRSRMPDQGLGAATAEQRAGAAALTAGNSTVWDPATPDRRAAVDAALPQRAVVTPKKSRKLLVIDLNVGYPGHQSIPTHNYGLKQLGLRTGAYVAVFDNNLDNLKYPKIKQYDAIFLNNTVGLIFEDPQVREGLLRFVREGGGIGGNHASIFANMDWPEYAQLMGALPSGHREPTERAWLRVADPASPITAGFGDRELLYQDEYVRFTDSIYSRDKLHILLSIDVAKTDMSQMDIPGRLNINLGREDSDYAVSWIREYGQGRVFYTALGHNPTLFTTPETARLMLSGLQYILGDLPADATPSARIQHGERKAP